MNNRYHFGVCVNVCVCDVCMSLCVSDGTPQPMGRGRRTTLAVGLHLLPCLEQRLFFMAC